MKPVTSASQAYREITEIERHLRGVSAERAYFAESYGGSDLLFEDIVIPEVDTLAQDAGKPAVSLAARLRATFLAALKRDARYAVAPRGELARMGHQREILTAYELARAYELTGT